MSPPTYGLVTKERTRKVLEALLDYADQNRECWIDRDNPQIRIRMDKEQLRKLIDVNQKDWTYKILAVFSDYLKDFLEILIDERLATQGSNEWQFSLRLWSVDKEDNLRQFYIEWEKRRLPSSKQKANLEQPSKSPEKEPESKVSTEIDWHAVCLERLAEHQKQLSSNPWLDVQGRNFSVYVPLGLVKREKKERPQLDRTQDPSADRGSEFYQEKTTPIAHDAFLQTVAAQKPGEHLVILGEPGAGKTTLLTKVWESLLKDDAAARQAIVVWVSLAALQGQDLAEYLEKTWLKLVCQEQERDAYWQSFQELVTAGRAWLLLDGADEMGGDGLSRIYSILQQAWAKPLRAVVTCRLNLWDASSRNELRQEFQIFRTLNFEYAGADGEDQVGAFIQGWFKAEGNTGEGLRAALEEPGKERIKDLAKNPLRLTLLCNIWQKSAGLPDTQAGLYKQFVTFVYRWKVSEKVLDKRERLDELMGELAKYGINKPSLRFRFTETELRQQGIGHADLGLLKDSGWLNCVGGDEDGDEVYAFFHPTFQEYFAACAIEDWDYFLPRAHDGKPVACVGEEVPTYRVFEGQWRQVILLWIGRDVGDELKEEFIEKLMNFREQAREFYCYRAYCMAAVCVGEFRFSKWAEEIVEQIVMWAFGYSKIDKQQWQTYLNPIESLAKETIPFTYYGYAVAALIDLLRDHNYDDLSSRVGATEVLGQIAIGNPTARAALIDLLHDHNCHDWLRCITAEALGKIDPGSPDAIEALIDAFCSRRARDSIGDKVVKALVQIDPGNPDAIKALIDLLHNDPDCEDYDRCYVAEALGLIDPGNPTAFEALIDFFRDPNCDGRLRWIAAEALEKIDPGNPTAFDVLINLVLDPKWDSYFRSRAAEALGKIDPDNLTAISALINFALDPKEKYHIRGECAAESLGQIAVGNSTAITVLIDLVLDHNLPWGRGDEVSSLGQIAVGNPDAIAALIKLLRDPNGEGGTRHCAAEALSSILSKTIMPSAIWQLKNDLADEVYRTRFKGYSFSYFVLFQCAKTLSYSEFHTAWHPSLPIIPFDPTSLHHQLNRPHTAILDLSNFHSSHPIDIAQELADLIFLELNPTNIPEVQTIPQFKRHLLQHSQPPHLVIIIHHPHPTTELITAITSLHSLKQIQIIWLTNTPIENAIPPNQPNLAGVIQEAIDRFTES